MSNRVLIASLPLRHQPGRFREILVEAGLEPLDPPYGENQGELSDSCIHDLLPQCVGVIAGSEKFTAGLFDKCPSLKIVARTGVGYDAVDVAAAVKLGICVTITPGVNQESVAEQAFGVLLGFTRRITVNCQDIAVGGWDRTMPIPLRGKTMGLIGLGRTGMAMVNKSAAFGMNILAFDPMVQTSPMASQVTMTDLNTLLQNSDVISLHVPLIPETRHLIRSETIHVMKDGVIIVNTARGGLISEPDLVEALNSGKIAGACLDVTDPEPPLPDSPLRTMKNVVLSPHLGGIDTKSMADMAEMAAWCIVEQLAGREPVSCVVRK